MAEELKKRETKLDVLVNNSGSNWGEPYDTFPDAAVCCRSLPRSLPSSIHPIPSPLHFPRGEKADSACLVHTHSGRAFSR